MVAKVTWWVWMFCAGAILSAPAWGAECMSYWSLDEGEGFMAYDTVGGHDGVVNGPEWVEGPVGLALRFDGENDYMHLPDNNPMWLPQEDFSLAFWICFDDYPGDVAAEQEVIFDFNFAASSNPDNETGFNVLRRCLSGRLSFTIALGSETNQSLPSTMIPQKDTWYHVVVTREYFMQSMYINGQLDRQRECTTGPVQYVGGYDNNAITIGRYTTTLGSARYHFGGMLDDIMLFEGGLSAEETLALFQGDYDVNDARPQAALLTGGDPNSVVEFTTIQAAIDAAADGDVVNILPGVHTESIAFAGKAITVQGAPEPAILEAPEGVAVAFDMGEGRNSVLRHVIIRNSQTALYVASSAPTISNVTVVQNVTGAVCLEGGDPDIRNSIFWGNTEADLSGCQASYCCVERDTKGEGNFSADPLFFDSENGDYHLCSTRGRYWPEAETWVLDEAMSPCVDAGDPLADYSQERLPNGGCLNVGAYGGTEFASMSETPIP